MWILVSVVFFWVLLGCWVAIFPGTLEPLLGVDYDFRDSWGVSRAAFHGLTLGTLAVMFVVALVGYMAGKGVRERNVPIPIEPPAPAPGQA